VSNNFHRLKVIARNFWFEGVAFTGRVWKLFFQMHANAHTFWRTSASMLIEQFELLVAKVTRIRGKRLYLDDFRTKRLSRILFAFLDRFNLSTPEECWTFEILLLAALSYCYFEIRSKYGKLLNSSEFFKMCERIALFLFHRLAKIWARVESSIVVHFWER